MFFSNDDEIADERLEQVLHALQQQDRAGLKAMFSQTALSQAEDFDGCMDYLFSFFEGNVISWESSGGPGVVEDIDMGKIRKKFTSWYYIKTDRQSYIFFLVEYVSDDKNPENVGLHTLRVILQEDEETEFVRFDEMEQPGIYRPQEGDALATAA